MKENVVDALGSLANINILISVMDAWIKKLKKKNYTGNTRREHALFVEMKSVLHILK